MKTSIRALVTLLMLVSGVASAQSVFPNPGQNIWLDSSKLLYGTIPTQALGTNTVTPGFALFSDGNTLYWGSAASGGGTTTNLTINNLTNINFYSTTAYITNLNSTTLLTTNITIYDSLTVNTNVTINQKISVGGHATFNDIVVTNNLVFTTNAYPIGAAGTTFDLSKPYQELQTNASFNVTALAGLSNNLVNWGVLQVSNSGASSITMGFTVSGAIAIGASTTNSLIIPSTKMAVLSVNAWGNKRVTYVTAAGQ